MNFLMILIILIPLVMGLVFLIIPDKEDSMPAEVWLHRLSLAANAAIALTVVCTGVLLAGYAGGADLTIHVLRLTEKLELYLHLDDLGTFFLGFISILWLLTGIFSSEYLKHEKRKKRFWAFYLLTLAALQGICCAGNLVTMYVLFEAVTLLSMALVFHSQTHEAVMAGLKYLFYSLAGAYCSLFGIFLLYYYLDDLTFKAGGILDAAVLAQHPTLFLTAIFFMIIGFGAKAGMFPMHAWLPTAHPVAPAPGSAMLSALVIKSGIFCIIRTVYYIVGADLLRGTWVQYTWLGLAAYSVFMGSMLAYNENVLKKRLAYSSVSQSAYINLGLAALTPVAMTGALLHVAAHAVIKTTLFLTAGAIIYKTGRTRVPDLHGLGKRMPKTLWCFTFASLALVGIPPCSGFVSKWYLATGLLQSGAKVFYWLGPVVLLVSALLTAGYLLTITIRGFFPGADFVEKISGPAHDGHESIANAASQNGHASIANAAEQNGHASTTAGQPESASLDPNWRMLLPLYLLAAGSVLLGLFANPLLTYLSGIAGSVM